MPKGPKSVGQLCAELGMDAVAELNFRKECQAFLKDHITDVPNANDEFVEAAALKFLNSGAGSKHFSWDSALNYQWEASDHRLNIVNSVGDIMKQQRWYIIDRLHKRFKGAVNCPGCLLHKPAPGSAANGSEAAASDDLVDDTVLTAGSDAESIHHVATRTGEIRSGDSRKRTRASLGTENFTHHKRRKSTISEDSTVMTEVEKRGSQSRPSTANHTSAAPNVRPSGFTPVNRGTTVEFRRPPTPEPLPASNALGLTGLKEFSTYTMRYRGKTWNFKDVAHKAIVLEQILIQEEKDVEAYPIQAFSKGARKAAFGGVEDPEGANSALKDYFRFYTHFMTDRFPINEKILLENGVRPSV